MTDLSSSSTNIKDTNSAAINPTDRGRSVLSSSSMDIKDTISAAIDPTDRGRSVSPAQIEEIEQVLLQLEDVNALAEPTRSPLTGGSWTVDYTTAPAPSNGQLGPFKGLAQQVISLEDREYRNLLTVPPNDWLTAALDATWVEWDGVMIEETPEEIKKWTGKDAVKEEPPKQQPSFLEDLAVKLMGGGKATSVDYGGTCWRVTFETITISLFGIPLFANKFDNVQRIWRTTYLDEDTRIVRAGRTGSTEDEMVFYMTRTEE